MKITNIKAVKLEFLTYVLFFSISFDSFSAGVKTWGNVKTQEGEYCKMKLRFLFHFLIWSLLTTPIPKPCFRYLKQRWNSSHFSECQKSHHWGPDLQTLFPFVIYSPEWNHPKRKLHFTCNTMCMSMWNTWSAISLMMLRCSCPCMM